jgi:hypothetical protein
VKSPPKYCKEVRGVPYLQHNTGTTAQKKFAPHWYIGGGGRETMKKNGEFHSDSLVKPNHPAEEKYFSLFLFCM